MKTILLIFSLLFICNLSAQQDTLMLDSVSFQKNQIPNFFTPEYINDLPKAKSIVEYKYSDNFKQYFFLFFLNLLIVTTLLLSISKRKVKDFLNAIFNINLLRQLTLKEAKKNHSYIYAYFILFILFFLTYIYVWSKINQVNLDFTSFTIVLISFFVFEFLIKQLTKFILEIKEVLNVVCINDVSYMLLSIPVMICSLLLMVYLPKQTAFFAANFSIVLLFLIYLTKEIRNVLVLKSFKIKIGSFYFFLYFCTFKILPILIMVKYLGTNS